MTCTHCGESPLSVRYRLRFDGDAGWPRELDLYLCDACLSELCAESGIELVRSASTLVGELGE